MKDELERKVKALPDAPGVYMIKDAAGKILYIGKAQSLRKRVGSYLRPDGGHSSGTRLMLGLMADVEYIRTRTELDALVLEAELVNRNAPRYNVRLKDDKSYPYICVTTRERFPRIVRERKSRRTQGRYFGPYPDGTAVKRAIRIMTEAFKLRTCKRDLDRQWPSPCLNYHIGRCEAPCMGYVDEQRYAENVEAALEFLTGRSSEVLRRMESAMSRASERLDYEQAAKWRDATAALRKVRERQRVVTPRRVDMDLIGIAREGNRMVGVLFAVRDGAVAETRDFMLAAPAGEAEPVVAHGLITALYLEDRFLPPEILLDWPPRDKEMIEEWLGARAGRKVRIRTPVRGEGRALLDLAATNAAERLGEALDREARALDAWAQAADELARFLALDRPPSRIEGYDISQLGGADPVGARAVLVDGEFLKNGFRRYGIKTVEGIDDYAMMREVLRRRIDNRDPDRDPDPDLILIDGGRGHLAAALEVVRASPLAHVPVVSLAKEEELVFWDEASPPLRLRRSNEALKLLQRVRDEAHRFAVSYQRLKRKSRMLKK